MSSEKTTHYYVPESSPWPFRTSVILGVLAFSGANFIQQTSTSGLVSNEGTWGKWMTLVAVIGVLFMMYKWFADTIKESLNNLNSAQMDRSYRQSMLWFIFSEVMFFAAFFGALYYARHIVVPWLGGEGAKSSTHELLWPNFQAMWPLTTTPDGRSTSAMGPWGLPAINTALLLASSVTLTIAHHALIEGKRAKLKINLFLTLLLGFVFLFFQAEEYIHLYTQIEPALRLDSGIYGNTFFMLTGFHGAHVTIGATMLTIMFFRVLKGHFTPENHFAFEAAAWYWHFVDVVWLFLFVCVYWL